MPTLTISWALWQYRSVRFETADPGHPQLPGQDAVINYTDAETPYTRIIEHKHFVFGSTEPGTKTVISREYSAEWKPGDEPYYPVNDAQNGALCRAVQGPGRCRGQGSFRRPVWVSAGTYDMDRVIQSALARVRAELAK